MQWGTVMTSAVQCSAVQCSAVRWMVCEAKLQVGWFQTPALRSNLAKSVSTGILINRDNNANDDKKSGQIWTYNYILFVWVQEELSFLARINTTTFFGSCSHIWDQRMVDLTHTSWQMCETMRSEKACEFGQTFLSRAKTSLKINQIQISLKINQIKTSLKINHIKWKLVRKLIKLN